MSEINRNRMIPLHIADQAVAACEKEIAALKAEVERLRAASFVTAVPVEEYEKLKAEVERLRKLFADTDRLMLLDGEYEAAKVGTYARLRKATDAMADAIDIYRGWIRLPGDEPLREAFNRVIEAMKEGKTDA